MARSAGVLLEGTLLEGTLLEGTLLEDTLLEDTLLEGIKNRPKTTKSGGPKSAVFHGGSRVAEMPGRVGSGRAGTIRTFVHTLNNARFAPSRAKRRVFGNGANPWPFASNCGLHVLTLALHVMTKRRYRSDMQA